MGREGGEGDETWRGRKEREMKQRGEGGRRGG